MSSRYLPEGRMWDTPENQRIVASLSALQQAMEKELIVEGQTILCTPEHDLIVSLGRFTGKIPREEVAIGIREGTTREIAILSRVGKVVAFTITGIDCSSEVPTLSLSRRRAQELALQECMALPIGTVLPATVTHMEQFGAFVDIGCGFVSMIGIENISVSRIAHPSRRFRLGQQVFVLLKSIDPEKKRVFLSHKELLGTWDENMAQFQVGMTVPGYVRGVKEYGAFIELTPNLTGLADWTEGIQEDDRVSVYIKAIHPERMKIKLTVIHRLEEITPPSMHYMKTEGILTDWNYTSSLFQNKSD